MRFHRIIALRSAALLAAGLSAAALEACSGGDVSAPGAEQPASTLSLRLISSSSAPVVGQRVAIALDLSGKAPEALLGLQGRLAFDASRLAYVGQSSADGTFLQVNDGKAGELRLAAINTTDLRGRAAVFVFDVKAADALRGLAFTTEAASLASSAPAAILVGAGVQVAALDVPVAERPTAAQWTERLVRWGMRPGVAARPGDATIYGDVTLDGQVTVLDVQQVGRAAVGLVSLLADTRDFVAGNVTPFNNTVAGRVPGFEYDATTGAVLSEGVLDVTDLGQIARAATGVVRPVIGTPIARSNSGTGAPRRVVSANITANETWSRDTVYELSTIVRVQGSTLTIQPGTRIEGRRPRSGNFGDVTALFVERDGLISATGTPESPIVFTCTDFNRLADGTFETTPSARFKGCWGGVYIAGNAPINTAGSGLATSPAIPGRQTGGANQNQGEGGGPLYGGNNADDNSGTLRYARIEYAGFTLSLNNELNGLTLGGVGRGTTIDHIQIHGGSDDGIEFFGGTVNVSYLLLTGNSDDGFDIDFGYQGQAHSVIVQQDPNDSDKGIEADNTAAGNFLTFTPLTTPYLFNFTLVGALADNNAGANALNDAMHLRRGFRGYLRNMLVVGYLSGLRINDAATISSNGTTCDLGGAFGTLSVENTAYENVAGFFTNTANDPQVCSGQNGIAAYTTNLAASYIASEATNTLGATTGLVTAGANSIYAVATPDFRPTAGGAASTGAVAPPAAATYLPSALGSYRGAVAPIGSSQPVPWYAGWTRGWQSAATP